MKHLARHLTLEDRSQTSSARLHITRRASASCQETLVLALSKLPFVGASIRIVSWFPIQNASSGNGPSQWPPTRLGPLWTALPSLAPPHNRALGFVHGADRPQFLASR